MTDNEPIWIDVKEAGRWLGLHPNTVKRLPPSQLPYMKVGSRGDRRYAIKDVRSYIEKHMVR